MKRDKLYSERNKNVKYGIDEQHQLQNGNLICRVRLFQQSSSIWNELGTFNQSINLAIAFSSPSSLSSIFFSFDFGLFKT